MQYTGINQCNVVLDHLPEIEIDAALRDRVTGEALFLRSYYYFQLVQVFGDVPFLPRSCRPMN